MGEEGPGLGSEAGVGLLAKGRQPWLFRLKAEALTCDEVIPWDLFWKLDLSSSGFRFPVSEKDSLSAGLTWLSPIRLGLWKMESQKRWHFMGLLWWSSTML